MHAVRTLVGSPARQTKAPADDVSSRHDVAKWSKKGSEQSWVEDCMHKLCATRLEQPSMTQAPASAKIYSPKT